MSLSKNARDYLDSFNAAFERQNGYLLCRCYSCALPLLMRVYRAIQEGIKEPATLGDIISAINEDYMYSADYKLNIRNQSGLKCGYDCVHYEETIEACPFPFWAIDKSKLKVLTEMLQNPVLLDLINPD